MIRKLKKKQHLSEILGGICIHQGWIKCIKRYSNDIYSVTKDYISDKCCSFQLSIHQRIL